MSFTDLSRPTPARIVALATALLGALGCAVAAMSSTPMPGHARPQRIVSFNLCADQYLLALADPSQIAGLTHNANNADLSAAAGKTRGVHLLGTSAEEILAINPDLVVGMPARHSGILAALSGRKYQLLDLESAESYADIVAQIRTIAQAVGHSARGEALIARMDRELAAIPRRPRAGVAAYYQRRGYMTGTGTLIDDLMGRVGLTNLAGKLGKPVLSHIGLEELMMAQPDYLIVESATDRITDQGTEMLHHPLLANIKRLKIPQAWTVCGGPAYVQAARSLAQQLSAR